MPPQVVGGEFREPRGLGDSALARPSPCPPGGRPSRACVLPFLSLLVTH